MPYFALCSVLAMSMGPTALAAPDDTTRVSFEVASIKPTGPSSGSVRINFLPGGFFRANGITARMLIQLAYDVNNFEVSGPDWLGRETYTIEATSPASPQHSGILNLNLTPRAGEEDLMKLRLRSLLKERFQMMYHKEEKEQPRYLLVIAKGGSKLQESNTSQDGAPVLRPGRGRLTGTGVEVSLLVKELSRQLGRRIVDGTGLPGTYDFTLQWTDDVAPLGDANGSQSAYDAPSIFTALQEQLGLKLVLQRGLEDVMIIDHIERPSSN